MVAVSAKIRLMAQPILIVVLLMLPAFSQAEILTVTSWGGEYSKGQRLAFFDPFSSETGHRVVQEKWGGDIARIRAMVERNHYTTTVLDAEGEQVHQGCEQGILEEIDYARLGVSPDDLLPHAAHRCGVGSVAWSMVFAYDPSQLRGAKPASWKDFWDVDGFPGKRGLFLGVETNLEIALLADGVAPGQVYDELATREGRARAFAKLDVLRPYVIWWQAGAQAAQLLLDREVVMTSGWNGRLHSASTPERPIHLVWHGQLMYFEYWIIPRGHPNRRLAYEFIELATRPDRQAEMSRYIPYGPLHKGWMKFADPSLRERLPTSPANLPGALKVSPDYWGRYSVRLAKRFSRWLEN